MLESIDLYDKIYTLGPEGTFSNQAASLVGGERVRDIRYTTTLPQITLEVAKDPKALGVMPIENSTAGTVGPAQDSLIDSSVVIIQELLIPVHFALVSTLPPDKIKRFFCHSMAFNQTMNFTAKQMPQAQLMHADSNIHAGLMFLEHKDEATAAIIPLPLALTAPEYQLYVQAKNIQDHQENITRFVVITQKKEDCKFDFSKQKTSLFIALHEDRHSLLFELLREFHVFGINLCRLESRPSQSRLWAYGFFIDLYNNHRVSMCLETFADQGISFQVLGSYDRLES